MEREIFDIDGLKLFVSDEHRFGTDSVLLSKFINPSPKSIVCDLCTGCGIIPMMLAANGKKPMKIYGVDISESAFSLFSDSVKENSLENYIIPIKADIKANVHILRESVDIVTANPPYFKANTGKTRSAPDEANARHELLCDFDDAAKKASELLKYGGYFKFCHIPERLTEIIMILKKYNLEPKVMELIPDKNNNARLMLISAKKGGKENLIIRIKK